MNNRKYWVLLLVIACIIVISTYQVCLSRYQCFDIDQEDENRNTSGTRSNAFFKPQVMKHLDVGKIDDNGQIYNNQNIKRIIGVGVNGKGNRKQRNFIRTTSETEVSSSSSVEKTFGRNKGNYVNSPTFRIATNEQPDARIKTIRLQKLRNLTGTPSNILVFQDVLCEPIYPKVLLYNRIFKTGSTSISEYIKDVTQNLSDITLKTGTTEDWYKTGDHYPYPQHIEKYGNKPERLIYIGHFFFREKLKLNNSYTYINILREPVTRVVSHYFYMRNEKIRPEYRIQELKDSGQWNENLLDCVRNQHRGCEDNVMTHFICGTKPFCNSGTLKALKRAKKNLRKFYASVGVLEEHEDFLRILNKRLPSFFVKFISKTLNRSKTNSVPKSNISKSVLDMIRDRNRADLELYQFAKSLQSAQSRKCGFR